MVIWVLFESISSKVVLGLKIIDMGKKKTAKKTKEVSVAIAESASIGSSEPQQQTPRKRGRPRKIVEKTESEEIKEEQREAAAETVVEESESKKAKMGEEEEEEEEKEKMKEVATSSSVGDAKKEAELVPKGLLRGSVRRKGKPRKSS